MRFQEGRDGWLGRHRGCIHPVQVRFLEGRDGWLYTQRIVQVMHEKTIITSEVLGGWHRWLDGTKDAFTTSITGWNERLRK